MKSVELNSSFFFYMKSAYIHTMIVLLHVYYCLPYIVRTWSKTKRVYLHLYRIEESETRREKRVTQTKKYPL